MTSKMCIFLCAWFDFPCPSLPHQSPQNFCIFRVAKKLSHPIRCPSLLAPGAHAPSHYPPLSQRSAHVSYTRLSDVVKKHKVYEDRIMSVYRVVGHYAKRRWSSEATPSLPWQPTPVTLELHLSAINEQSLLPVTIGHIYMMPTSSADAAFTDSIKTN